MPWLCGGEAQRGKDNIDEALAGFHVATANRRAAGGVRVAGWVKDRAGRDDDRDGKEKPGVERDGFAQ